ncbi:MAG: DUF2541 domain-containing protein [Hyphomicrobiaceae bacterium]
MTRNLRIIVTLLAALFTIVTNTTVNAQITRGDRWVLLKTVTIDASQGFADIDLEASKGSYKAVRLRTRRNGLLISEVQVDYAKADTHVERRRINLRRGLRSRPINLSRTERFLRSIAIEYKPQRKGRKSQLQVWALQSRKGRLAKRPSLTADANQQTGATTVPAPEPKPKAAASIESQPSESSDILFAAEHVGFNSDTQTIPVGRQVGKFRRIRMRVVNNDIVLKKLEIHYSDGKSETREINQKITRNTTTDWFDLPGDQFVKDIRLQYESRPNFRGQARIEAFGEFADGWLGPTGEARKFNRGWVMLGAQAAGFVGFDKDAIQLTRGEGAIEKIEVRVRDRAITLSELRVVYGNGNIDVIPVKTRVDAGKSFGPIKIARNNRQVTEIQARYRSRFLDREARNKGSAIVEFWAKD